MNVRTLNEHCLNKAALKRLHQEKEGDDPGGDAPVKLDTSRTGKRGGTGGPALAAGENHE